MRVKYNKDASKIINDYKYYINKVENKILEGSINLEIGMGKGDFLIKSAFLDPNNIYIGVEVNPSVLAAAIKKINKFEEENNYKFNNLYIMLFNAEELDNIFPENSIDNLYLNFSDPWPKTRHEKRRLTYSTFLDKYSKVLRDGSNINIKTDNRGLFEFTIKSINNYGLKFEEVYLDLHKIDINNIVTEYEEKFSKFGPIYKLVVRNNKKNFEV